MVMVYVLLIVFGLVAGSFINAWVWRIHEQRELAAQKKPDKKRAAALSMTKGRSMCSKCSHPLAAKDLIPLFSWLLLAGRCRYCKQPIGDNPIIEVLMPILFSVSYWQWPHQPHGPVFIVWLLALVFLMALAYYDLRWFILPDMLNFSLIGIAVVYVVCSALQRQDSSLVLQSIIGAGLISGLFYLLYKINQQWIGFGDVKLGIALGLLAGSPLMACLVLFSSSLIGTLVNLPQLGKGKAGLKVQVPFGPLLVTGTILIVIFGPAINRFLLQVP